MVTAAMSFRLVALAPPRAMRRWKQSVSSWLLAMALKMRRRSSVERRWPLIAPSTVRSCLFSRRLRAAARSSSSSSSSSSSPASSASSPSSSSSSSSKPSHSSSKSSSSSPLSSPTAFVDFLATALSGPAGRVQSSTSGSSGYPSPSSSSSSSSSKSSPSSSTPSSHSNAPSSPPRKASRSSSSKSISSSSSSSSSSSPSNSSSSSKSPSSSSNSSSSSSMSLSGFSGRCAFFPRRSPSSSPPTGATCVHHCAGFSSAAHCPKEHRSTCEPATALVSARLFAAALLPSIDATKSRSASETALRLARSTSPTAPMLADVFVLPAAMPRRTSTKTLRRTTGKSGPRAPPSHDLSTRWAWSTSWLSSVGQSARRRSPAARTAASAACSDVIVPCWTQRRMKVVVIAWSVQCTKSMCATSVPLFFDTLSSSLARLASALRPTKSKTRAAAALPYLSCSARMMPV
mmetsp:Transcript_5143/g.16331  ORF Transcript_5143/g.16331 Transcript_5143/m.16331 type:complete len:460 (+) Transcript_5143:649-2028(+)